MSDKKNELTTKVVKDKKIIDVEEMKLLIEPLLLEHKVLQAVSLLAEKYKDNPVYKELKFKDWFGVVDAQYEKLF